MQAFNHRQSGLQQLSVKLVGEEKETDSKGPAYSGGETCAHLASVDLTVISCLYVYRMESKIC